jgi:hypothetical protein
LTFQEVLFGLLSVHTKKTLLVKGEDWKGEVSIKGDCIIDVIVENDGILEGMEGLKFILDRENEIKSVDLMPLKVEKGRCQIGQMELFSLLSDKFELPGEELSTDIGDFSETIQAEENIMIEDKGTTSEIERGILRVSSEFFDQRNIKYIITNESNNSEIKVSIVNLIKETLAYKNCSEGEIVETFSKYFLLIVYSGEKFIALIIDSKELPDFKLNEPFIIGELRKLLTSQN